MVDNTYYLDPNFDRSAIKQQDTSDKYLGLVRPDIRVGERQVPGQDGWRLADTPQVWVYIQKKQWVDETWTYVVGDTTLSITARKLEDKIAERSQLQTKLDTINQISTARPVRNFPGATTINQILQKVQTTAEGERAGIEQQIAFVSKEIAALQAELDTLKASKTIDRVGGKLQQIDIRSALGRIITRKIDWMSDHEKFTKVSGAVQNMALNTGQQRIYRQRMQDLILNVAYAVQEIDMDIGILQDNIDSYNARIDQALQNIRSLQQAMESNNLAISVKRGEAISYPDRAVALQKEIDELTQKNEDIFKAIVAEQENITTLNAYIKQMQEWITYEKTWQDDVIQDNLAAELVSDDELDLDPLVIEDSSPITFSGNAFTRYYKAPITRTKDTKQVQLYKTELEAEKTRLENVIKEVVNSVRQQSNPAELYAVPTEELDQLATIHKSYVQIRRKIYQLENAIREGLDTAPVILESGDPVFNGVMELANVSSVNTNVSVEGEGSAEITLENPQNVFYINEEDILLSLVDIVQENILTKLARLGKQMYTNLVYYKGAYYPSYIVQMLSRAPSSSVDLRLITDIGEATRKAQNVLLSPATLKEYIADNEKEQKDIQAEMSKGALDVGVGTQRVAALQTEWTDLKKQLAVAESRNVNSSRAAGDKVDVDWDTINSGPTKEILTRYYQGKTIFEVLDRVFIWMTTPTRTPFKLAGESKFAIEDPGVLSTAQQKVQVDNEIQAIEAEIGKFNIFYKEMQKLAQAPIMAISYFGPNSYDVPTEYLELSGKAATIQMFEIEKGNTYSKALEYEKGRLESISKCIEKELADSDSFTAARIRDRLSDKSSMGAYSDTQYEARSLGIEEQKLQVFQGVIAAVKRTYSEGKYQITLSCRDNMVFLDMSRIMQKPALNIDVEPIGVLDDPIWRYTQRAGIWKDGILVVNQHFIGDEIEQRIRKKVQLTELAPYDQRVTDTGVTSETQGRQKWTPLVLTEPFAQIDAANVISLLVTGIPYNPITFMQSASLGGRTPLTTTVSGSTDQQSKDTTYFSTLRKQVGSQNDRLGDFQPFLDFESGVYRKNDLEKQQKLYEDELTSSFDLLTRAYINYISMRVAQYGKAAALEMRGIISTTGYQDIMKRNACNMESAESTKTEMQSGASKAFLDRLLEIIKDVVARKGGTTTVTQKSAEEKAKGNGATVSSEEGQAAQSTSGSKSEWFKAITTNEGLEGLMPVSTDKIDELVKKLATMGDADGPFGKLSNSMLAAIGAKRETVLKIIQTGTISKTTKVTPDYEKALEYYQWLRYFTEDLFIYDLAYKTQFNAAIIATRRLNEYKQLTRNFSSFMGGYESKDASTSSNTGKTNVSPVPTPINLLASSPEKIIRKRKVNYLVISDRYTLDLDVQAFVAMIGFDPDLFQAETESPLSICRRAADEVDFEFYCDENGHIRFKPPTYNRILKEHYNKLGDTDRVAKDALLVEYGADYGQLVKKLIQAQAKIQRVLHEYQAKADELVRIKKEVDQKKAPGAGAPKNESEALEAFYGYDLPPTAGPTPEAPSACLGRVKTELAFDLKVALEVESRLNDVGFYETTQLTVISNSSQNEAAQVARLISLYDTIIATLKQLLTMAETSLNTARMKADNAVKKLNTFYDEFRIHKIPDYNLISSDFTEAPPRFTRLDLVGSPQFAQLFAATYWSGGVDYDMWRNYGYIYERMQKAYFHDGAACIPYTRAMLGRERGRIFSGSITVRGDAKYRVGDCVFIEDEAMYYYITTVSHSFSYGGTFTTSLTLAYGRRIGEIIPHPFDVLGGIVLSTYQSDLETLLTQEVIRRQEEKKVVETEAAKKAAEQAAKEEAAKKEEEAKKAKT